MDVIDRLQDLTDNLQKLSSIVSVVDHQNVNENEYNFQKTRDAINLVTNILRSLVTFDQKQKLKTTDQTLNTTITSSPSAQPHIPQQSVIFSNRFDGGMNKGDAQCGNIGELFDEPSSSTLYQQSEVI